MIWLMVSLAVLFKLLFPHSVNVGAESILRLRDLEVAALLLSLCHCEGAKRPKQSLASKV